MNDEEYKVTSELYEEYNYSSTAKPGINTQNVVSQFPFRYPPEEVKYDADGDLIVERKQRCSQANQSVIEIEHSCSTVLDLVGHQVWRGALLLADWIFCNRKTISKDFFILELGSGVGLTSIIAAMYAPVICTDVDRGDILKLLESNVARNNTITKYPVTVLPLDFMAVSICPEMSTMLSNVQFILAADVVYDDKITEAFVRTVGLLLSHPPHRAVYVALEKRFVFTIADCDTAAPCYDYFLQCLETLENITKEEIKIDFQQYFQYERVKELVLWKISSKF